MVIYFSKENIKKTKKLEQAIIFENTYKINEYNSWLNFSKRVQIHRQKTIDIINRLKNKKIIGFGASARSQTYLNYCEIDFKKVIGEFKCSIV